MPRFKRMNKPCRYKRGNGNGHKTPPVKFEQFPQGKIPFKNPNDFLASIPHIPVVSKEFRPNKYEPEFCERVIEMMSRGLLRLQVANRLGITYGTLFAWEKQIPEFSIALSLGDKLCEDWWIEVGKAGMSNPNFKCGPYTLIMGNKLHWHSAREKVEVNEKKTVNVTVGISLDVEGFSDGELDAITRIIQASKDRSGTGELALPAPVRRLKAVGGSRASS